MSDSCYQPPNQYSVLDFTPFSADSILKSRDSRTIKLECLEHKIKSYNFMRICMAGIMLIILIRLGCDMFDTNKTVPLSIIMARMLQIMGFVFGFGAHSSKKVLHAQIFFAFLVFSFFEILYFSNWAYLDKDYALFIEDLVSFVLNSIVMCYCWQFCKLLAERDSLKRGIGESLVAKHIETL